MSYNDDEPIVVQSSSDGGDDDATEFDQGAIKMTVINKNTAPLAKNEFNVMVELEGLVANSDRIPVDLVLVLDVSGSMAGDKIQTLKTATEFVIKKLGPVDRVSIVKFSGRAHRLCPLRQITNTSQDVVLKYVTDIKAGGSTNITDGLEMGKKVLDDRMYSDGRLGAIMLMSDGEQNAGSDATKVDLDGFHVDTFGFGADHDPKVLKAIADNGDDGTFSDVQDDKNLSSAFAQALAGLLFVVVQNLKLTVSTAGFDSSIKEVQAGNYPQSSDCDSVTISFCNLYSQEVRKVIVLLDLPAVVCDTSEIILQIQNTQGDKNRAFPPATAEITRTDNSVEPEKESIAVEKCRNSFAKKIKEARNLADGNHMEDAKKKVVEGAKILEESEYPNNPVIGKLKQEHETLTLLMASTQIYKEKGHSFALSFESSHDRQRFSLRGDAEKHRMFATPRMDTYLEQVKSFQKDPTKPLPTEKEDRAEELAAMLARRAQQ